MKKLTYIFVLSITLSMLFVVSCGEDKSNDTTPPRVFDVRFNVNDTILFMDNGVQKKITLNDTSEVRNSLEPDILVIGKRIRFRGSFSDDQGLSTAYIKFWGDSSQVDFATTTDTCFQLRRLMSINMFGSTETRVGGMGLTILDRLPEQQRRESGTKYERKELNVRHSGQRGDEDNYYFSVLCVDVAGNEDVTSYSGHPIMIHHRDSIINEWKKNNGSLRKR